MNKIIKKITDKYINNNFNNANSFHLAQVVSKGDPVNGYENTVNIKFAKGNFTSQNASNKDVLRNVPLQSTTGIINEDLDVGDPILVGFFNSDINSPFILNSKNATSSGSPYDEGSSGDYVINTSSGERQIVAYNGKGSNNEEKIWNYLRKAGFSKTAVAGIMGNLAVESGFNPTNLQNSFEEQYGSDKEYTEKVDSKKITEKEFIYDNAGYGLAQWTFWSRKQALYRFKDSKSIGDLGMQLEFMLSEIGDSLFKELKKEFKNVEEATIKWMKEYESPGVPHRDQRISEAKRIYSAYKNK